MYGYNKNFISIFNVIRVSNMEYEYIGYFIFLWLMYRLGRDAIVFFGCLTYGIRYIF